MSAGAIHVYVKDASIQTPPSMVRHVGIQLPSTFAEDIFKTCAPAGRNTTMTVQDIQDSLNSLTILVMRHESPISNESALVTTEGVSGTVFARLMDYQNEPKKVLWVDIICSLPGGGRTLVSVLQEIAKANDRSHVALMSLDDESDKFYTKLKFEKKEGWADVLFLAASQPGGRRRKNTRRKPKHRRTIRRSKASGRA